MSEQESVDRINAMLAEMPPLVARRLVQQLAQEWQRQEQAPTPLERGPDFPYRRLSTVARWACRTGCGWAYEEDADPGLPGPLVLPANFTPADVSAAISRQAGERHQALRDRVDAALREHYRTEHPHLLEDVAAAPAEC
ncbi:hypothetical protein [Streptomyces sp. KAU_LT]|uniref:hypothetical protein n=1 Tax=Streptomyces sp. KAU_LT TaxID=3046669 RepID=UPI0024B73A36|nr:hypothetical protein [Streptomyces sp. KAU_LT]MDI9829667.1 hypothetical protein [Streptomyces sp. KAU_LT]